MKRIAMIAALILLVGCKDDKSPASAPAVQPAPIPVAGRSTNNQLPTAVQNAFTKDRNDSTIQKVKHRMNPDGVVHYTITSADSNGMQHTDEYRADGVLVK